jgi:hypothetical protein
MPQQRQDESSPDRLERCIRQAQECKRTEDMSEMPFTGNILGKTPYKGGRKNAYKEV